MTVYSVVIFSHRYLDSDCINVMKRVVRLHFKPISCMEITMYDNYNVTTWPMVVFFTRNTCASKTLAHKAVLIPPIYMYYRCTSFPIPNSVNFQLYLDIFGVNLLGEIKIIFLAITFSYCRLLSPNFACRVGLKYFLYDIAHNSCCCLVFEKTQL